MTRDRDRGEADLVREAEALRRRAEALEGLGEVAEPRATPMPMKAALLVDVLGKTEDIGIVATTTDGCITYFNAAAEDILGRSAAEVYGRELGDVATEGSGTGPRLRDTMDAAREHGESRTIIKREKNGEPRHIEIRATCMPGPHGEALGYSLFCRDVSDLVKAEAFRRESERRFEDVAQTSLNWFWETDSNGRFTYVSQRVKEVLGYEPHEILSRHPLDLMPEEEARRLDQPVRECFSSKSPFWNLESWRLAKDGRRVCVLSNGVPILSEEGELLGHRGVDNDVTESRIAEERIRESRDFLQTIVDGIPDPLMVINRNFTIALANRALREKGAELGLSCTGSKCHEISHGSKLPCEGLDDPCPLRQVFEKKMPVTVTHFHHGPGGTVVPVEVVTAPIFNEAGEIVQVVECCRDISARRQVEAALHQSERLLQTVVNTTKDAMIAIGDDGRISLFNPAAEEMFGVSLSEMEGKGLECLMPEEFRETHKQYVRDFFATGKPNGAIGKVVELPALRANGEQFPMEISLAEGLIENERFVVAVARDVTERKRSETILRDAEARLRSILNSLQTGVIVIEPESHTIVDANPAATRMAGLSREEIVGKSCFDFICAQKEGNCPLTDGGLMVDNEECFLLTAEGEEIPILKTAVFADLDGRPNIVESFIDIRDRKQAEAERARLIAAIEQAAEAFIVLGVDWRIQYANPAFERITAYSCEEAVGLPLEVLLSEEGEAKARGRQAMRANEGGENWQGRILMERRDGATCKTELTASPVRGTDGRIVNFVCVGRDVTHEEELESQLRQSQKMEAIGTLAGGIAHDFNNLLQAILGYTDLAQDDIPEGTPPHDCLVEVCKAGTRAGELVGQILAFSRQSEQERKPLRLQSIVKEALKLLRGSLPSTIEIVQDIQNDCCPILADPTQMHQVIMNLCTNAYHAMRETGGRLDVGLKEIESASLGMAEETGLAAGRYVCLSIRDTGQGIDEETMKRIFDPYFTTKGLGEGTGMGLAMVHGIVEGNGGVVLVDSEPGQGALFQIFLPECVPAGLHESDKREMEGRPTGVERVLFVDDEEAVARQGAKGLERLGYKVEARMSSIEALDAFRAHPDRFDIVVTDQLMPNMTGLELAENLVRIRPDIPIILCTGFSETLRAEDVLARGIRAFVMKPIIAADLAASLRRVLDEES